MSYDCYMRAPRCPLCDKPSEDDEDIGNMTSNVSYLEAFAAADRAATEDRDARWAAIGIVPGAGAAAGA